MADTIPNTFKAPKLAVITMTQAKDYPMSYFGLRQIHRTLPEGATFHILINGTMPGLKTIFEFSDACTVHEVPENLGVAAGRNLLIEHALSGGADDILSLDDDFILPANFFEDLLSARDDLLANGEKVGIVSPAIVNYRPFLDLKPLAQKAGLSFPEIHPQYMLEATSDDLTKIVDSLFFDHTSKVMGALYHLGVRDWKNHYYGTGSGEYLKARRAIGMNLDGFEATTNLKSDKLAVVRAFGMSSVQVGNLPGGASLYSRSLIDSIGKMDTKFSPFGYEDADFSIRAANAGFRNFLVPSVMLIHDIMDRRVSRSWSSLLAGQGRFQGRALNYLEPIDRPIALFSAVSSQARRMVSGTQIKKAHSDGVEAGLAHSVRLLIDYSLILLANAADSSPQNWTDELTSLVKALVNEESNLTCERMVEDDDALMLRGVQLLDKSSAAVQASIERATISTRIDKGIELRLTGLDIDHTIRHKILYPIFSDAMFKDANDAAPGVNIFLSLSADGQLATELEIGGSKVETHATISRDGETLNFRSTRAKVRVSKWLQYALAWWQSSYEGQSSIGFEAYVLNTICTVFRTSPDSTFATGLVRAVLKVGRADAGGEDAHELEANFGADTLQTVRAITEGLSWAGDEAPVIEDHTGTPDFIRERYYGRWGSGLSDSDIASQQASLKKSKGKNSSDWLNWQNAHAGERCFVIGNGPSLNRLDLSKLRTELSIGVNSIFLHPEFKFGTPKHYVVEDTFVAEDRAERIQQITDRPCWYGQYLRGTLPTHDNVNWLNVALDYKERPDFPTFSENLAEEALVGGSVTYICMQLAYFLGFSKVYLIGFDHDYIVKSDVAVQGNTLTSHSDDPNHFDPSYFGKGYRWHIPNVERMERGYLRARQAFEADGRKIFNATAGGKLDVFERVDFRSLF